MSKVDTFWGGHTVDDKTYKSIDEHRAYLDWRFSIYPQFKDMMGIYGYHDKRWFWIMAVVLAMML